MDTSNRKIWQIAAGDADRNYVDLCLKWGVILNGPGIEGPWPECRENLSEYTSSRKITDIWRFAEGISDGDLIVLRIGTSTVYAVGEVVGDYQWHPEFGDIDGWDIQHVRRVRWLWGSKENPKTFDTYALKRGDTTQKLDSQPVKDWLTELKIPTARYEEPLPELPEVKAERDIDTEDISYFLFDKGIAIGSINKLLTDMGELVRIAKWYWTNGIGPSEHETIAYLVIPLLRALGWTPQRMSVEWNRVDVALFNSLPREDKNLTVVAEVKKMGNSCLSAISQAQEYAQGKEYCRRLIVTDGIGYGIHTRSGPGDFYLSAYLNLTRLRSDYPVYPCAGARKALFIMTPEWRELEA